MGLHHKDTETWTYITEDEYNAIRPLVGSSLPTMAISKVKKDKDGEPQCAKYCVIVLGNLDPNNWDSSDCFAPVLLSLELQLLVSIATQMKIKCKSGDVSQAFVQSTLPADEKYVIRPPKGCPITPPHTLLLLKKTLYGLRRSPRHWYETCKKTLMSIGLKPLPNAPCIFTSCPIQGQPPLYLGLFVEDFIYFSTSPEVEATFSKSFSAQYKVNFEPEIQHFLGLKFTNVQHPNRHLDVYLNQPTDIQEIISKAGLSNPETYTAPTPYRSGFPVDTVPQDPQLSLSQQESQNKTLQEYVGSLQWLSNQTRPNKATITNLIAQYHSKAQQGHINTGAKYVIQYLKKNPFLGIKFSSQDNAALSSFVQFPTKPTTLCGLLPPLQRQLGSPRPIRPDRQRSGRTPRTIQIKIYRRLHRLAWRSHRLEQQTPIIHSSQFSPCRNRRGQ